MYQFKLGFALITFIFSNVLIHAQEEIKLTRERILKGVDVDGWFVLQSDNHDCCKKLRGNVRGNGAKLMNIQKCYVKYPGNSLEEAKGLAQANCNAGEFEVFHDMYVTINAPTVQWGLDRSDQTGPVLDGDFSPMYDGTGVTVYVVDTGINWEHVDFEGRASYGANFANGPYGYDQNGHGTHCSGIAVSKTYGVAKKANVIGVQVLGGSGSGSFSDVIAGIEWAVTHKQTYNTMGVISMSLGGPRYPPVDSAVQAAAAAGLMVAVAAGNDQNDACLYSPAAAGYQSPVITVGATEKGDARAYFSNFGSCVDMFAPGRYIVSTWTGSIYAINNISGTSMATPHVAGAAALFMQKHNGDAIAALADMQASATYGAVIDARGANVLLHVDAVSGPVPTESPTTAAPTSSPTASSTLAPTASPTLAPTASPTLAPTASPTLAPTASPTLAPTVSPTLAPTASPTLAPTVSPTLAPTAAPTNAPNSICNGLKGKSCRRQPTCQWSSGACVPV